jgi:hypothetical protein
MRGSKGVRLWLAWVAVNTLGGLVAFPVGGGVIGAVMIPQLAIWPTDSPRPTVAVVLGFASLALWPLLTGAGIGAAQWIVLRSIVGPAGGGGWIRKNGLLWLGAVVVAGVGVFVYEMAPHTRPRADDSQAIVLLVGLLLGLVVGIGQYFTLIVVSERAWAWLIAVPLGYMAGASLALAVVEQLPREPSSAVWFLYLLAASAVGGLVGGCVSGALTGAVLVWLHREPPPPDGAGEGT